MNEDPLKNKEKLSIENKLATPDDWMAYRELRLLAIGKTKTGLQNEQVVREEAKTEEEWRADLLSSDKFLALSFKGSIPIGMGLARKRKGGRVWSMYSGYVKPEHQGGVGKVLFAFRLNEILKRGGEEAIIYVNTNYSDPKIISIAEFFRFKRVKSDDTGYYMEVNLTDQEVIRKINEVLNAG